MVYNLHNLHKPNNINALAPIFPPHPAFTTFTIFNPPSPTPPNKYPNNIKHLAFWAMQSPCQPVMRPAQPCPAKTPLDPGRPPWQHPGAGILGKVLLELVAQGLLFNAVYDEHSETFTINLTGGY